MTQSRMKFSESEWAALSSSAQSCLTTFFINSRVNKITLASGVPKSLVGMSYARELIKLHLRARLNPNETSRWLSFWNSSPTLSRLACIAPNILKKIYRPYLSDRLQCKDRLNVLVSHYRFTLEKGLGWLVLRSASAPVVLAEFTGKTGNQYQIQFLTATWLEREGEFVLQLMAKGVPVYSIAFTLFEEKGECVAGIGCLQGGRTANAKDLIRQMTRDLYGLRPKILLVRIVQQITHNMDCKALYLTGNANRTVVRQMKKGLVKADYDATWLELGATPQNNGDFVLQYAPFSEAEIQALPSKKRSEARKRASLVAQVAADVSAHFFGPVEV